ncbi:MAG: 5-oxoprolinase subunit C family protein, partial [Desulfitobacteriaceae bacterium]
KRYVPDYSGICTLRVVAGLDAEMFPEETVRTFYSTTYEVSGQSDRMGCRLEGPVLNTGLKGDRVSDAMVQGGIQVPPNGQPIILSADQTVGGYPIIAVVASVDFTLVAQLSVTQKVRFEQISLEEAQTLRLSMENFLQSLSIAVGG